MSHLKTSLRSTACLVWIGPSSERPSIRSTLRSVACLALWHRLPIFHHHVYEKSPRGRGSEAALKSDTLAIVTFDIGGSSLRQHLENFSLEIATHPKF